MVIPIVPPLVFDLRGVFNLIGAMAGGPYAALIIGFLGGLPSPLALPSMLNWWAQSWVFLVFYKKIYYMRGPVRWVALGGALFVAEVISHVIFVGGTAALRLVPFYPLLTAWFLTGFWVWLVADGAGAFLTLKLIPSFVEPTWSWRPRRSGG